MSHRRKITPCLWFEHVALEAARYYVGIFGGSIDAILTAKTDTPGNREGDVLLVEFTVAGEQYQAINGGPHDKFNDAISLSVLCEDQAEIDRLWSALTSDGGRPVQCGWVKDRYGLSWQVVPRRLFELISDPDPARGKRVMQAMLEMIRLDIAQLEAAAAGR
ncbi:MAG: VOC family protein [Hyphomicrobiaceae bacterium]